MDGRATTDDGTVTAVVVHGAGDLRVETRARPEPRDDQALVEVLYGGVCGSDLHYAQHGAAGASVLRTPMVLGHEVVGVVARAARDGSGPAAGTPVAVHPGTQGNDPGRWPADRPNLAPGSTYLGSAATLPHQDGAFASVVALDTRMLRPLPDGLDLRRAALIEPAAVAWHAFERAGDVRGLRVLVVGSGPIGALAVAVAVHHGAADVVAVDLHELPLRIATAVGATTTIRASEDAALDAVDADVVIESSGTHQGLATAVRGATRGGRVVMLGLPPAAPQPVLVATAITRELELVGSFRFVDEIDDVIRALADGSLVVDPVVTHEYPAGDAAEAFRVAADASVSGKVLLRF